MLVWRDPWSLLHGAGRAASLQQHLQPIQRRSGKIHNIQRFSGPSHHFEDTYFFGYGGNFAVQSILHSGCWGGKENHIISNLIAAYAWRLRYRDVEARPPYQRRFCHAGSEHSASMVVCKAFLQRMPVFAQNTGYLIHASGTPIVSSLLESILRLWKRSLE